MTATTTIPVEGIMTFLNTMTLSSQSKRWLGEHLIEQAEKEERSVMRNSSQERVFKARRRTACSPSDAELEARFAGTEMPELPDDPDWHQVIKANTGKTIKPIEKWLNYADSAVSS